MFCLGKREENITESRINSFGWEHGDKGAKSMEVKGSKDMLREFCKVHAKRDV